MPGGAVKPGYVVKISHVAQAQILETPTPSLRIDGTSVVVDISGRNRDHFTTLRDRIERSGVNLKSAEELDNEIAESKREK